MTGYSERTECAEIAAIFEGYETKGHEDEENGLFVDVPTEKEGGVAAETDCANKGIPGRLEEQSDETNLKHVSI